MVPGWLADSLAELGRLVPAVHDMADERGTWYQDRCDHNLALTRDMPLVSVGTLQPYTPQTLCHI